MEKFVLITLLGVPLGGWARRHFVVVSATAAETYERRTEKGELRPESYIISPGEHFGVTGDKSMVQESFGAVLQGLAPALAKQQYWPAKDPEMADLVIVVHWGETEVWENPLKENTADLLNDELKEFNQAIDEFGIEDPGRLNELKAAQGVSMWETEQKSRMNAELLGYRSTLDKEEKRYFPSEEERTLKTEFGDNRYFVVLMAWDYSAIKAKEPPRLKWVTRMSVRSAGHKFFEVTRAMVEQATPHFGVNRDGLVRTKTDVVRRKGEVEIGESKVVEEAPPPASP
ncbi:MAG: hypothetical protein J6386_17210 [Candidatus Synoicihabitans palmerolidicus]|nr:hypothetical protein [Candidatus Synoicihabitans palmerolidicus]